MKYTVARQKYERMCQKIPLHIRQVRPAQSPHRTLFYEPRHQWVCPKCNYLPMEGQSATFCSQCGTACELQDAGQHVLSDNLASNIDHPRPVWIPAIEELQQLLSGDLASQYAKIDRFQNNIEILGPKLGEGIASFEELWLRTYLYEDHGYLWHEEREEWEKVEPDNLESLVKAKSKKKQSGGGKKKKAKSSKKSNKKQK